MNVPVNNPIDFLSGEENRKNQHAARIAKGEVAQEKQQKRRKNI